MVANELYSKIVAGEIQLLTAEDICGRLGVSRTTFDRWVRNSSTRTEGGLGAIARQGLPLPTTTGFQRTVGIGLSDASGGIGALGAALSDGALNMAEGKIEFPLPDVRIGRSPRWTFETVVAWLEKNSTL
jgi:predicted DNA-binding transcriptional regulator AlpA